MTNAEAIEKVRKLLAKGENPAATAEEAALFAAKAAEIMERHRIEHSMLTINESAEEADDEPIENFARKGAPLDEGSQVATWRSWLADGIARHNQCEIFTSRSYRDGRRRRTIEIVGRASDVETVRYLFGYVAAEIDRLADQHGRGCGRNWKNQFRLGAVESVRMRLAEMRRALREQFRAGKDATALVVVNTALARLDAKSQMVQLWMKRNMRLRAASGSSSQYNPSAREQGREAGKSINLTNGGGKSLTGGRLLS